MDKHMQTILNRKDYRSYRACVEDLLADGQVRRMAGYVHHRKVSCLEHSLYVSYLSYKISLFFALDYRSAARGALLHDLFLYDWHTDKPQKGMHAFIHPQIALANAQRQFALNDMERDIIQKHMWPLTGRVPRYAESFVVTVVDKYCAIREIL